MRKIKREQVQLSEYRAVIGQPAEDMPRSRVSGFHNWPCTSIRLHDHSGKHIISVRVYSSPNGRQVAVANTEHGTGYGYQQSNNVCYGYCKQSTAAAEALKAAGVTFYRNGREMYLDGTGMSSIERALYVAAFQGNRRRSIWSV